jgi:cell wall-associated NlpC family hydrolase
MIADARPFTGVYYLWGGSSAWGIDCSGLAQLVHRLSGYEIPRDCHLQFPVGRPSEPPFSPGDLLYFWNDARTMVGHVGISTGGWNIIHSSRTKNGVYEEDVRANEGLRNSFAGARSFLQD